jgi:hypothetical protein
MDSVLNTSSSNQIGFVISGNSKLQSANMPLVPTRNGEAPLLAAQRRR